MSYNCYITAHVGLSEVIRIQIPWWRSSDLLKTFQFEKSEKHHVVKYTKKIDLAQLKYLHSEKLPWKLNPFGKIAEEISPKNQISFESVEELIQKSNRIDQFIILLEKVREKYKPYEKFLEEEGEYLAKYHQITDESGLLWIYDTWTDSAASEFLEVVFAYISLKEQNQLE